MTAHPPHPRPTTLDLHHDGVLEITTPEQATALAAHLLNPDRDQPIVVISVQPGVGWAIDADTIYDAVTPLARVARIRNGSPTFALAGNLPPGTPVYGSAARVYPTGTGWTTDPASSLLRVPRHSHQAAWVAETLIEAALAAGYSPPTQQGCTCHESRALRAQVRDLQRQIAGMKNRPEKAATTAPHPGRPTQSRPQPTNDPETRFRAEVRAQWQERVAATDPSSGSPPDDYPLDPKFMATLARLTPTEYRKAASVAMEILTGLVHGIPARNVHRLRTGAGGNNPSQRTPTGHFILRANLQTNAPAARRIHWTLTPDGQIRLLAVTRHDQPLVA